MFDRASRDAQGRAPAAPRRDGAGAAAARAGRRAPLRRARRRHVSVVPARGRVRARAVQDHALRESVMVADRRAVLRRPGRRPSAAHLLHVAAARPRGAGRADARAQHRRGGARRCTAGRRDGLSSVVENPQPRTRSRSRRDRRGVVRRIPRCESINRTAVTIIGAKPYIDWTRDTDADVNKGASPWRAPRPYGSAFLLPEFELEEDVQEWMEENAVVAVRISALGVDRRRSRRGRRRATSRPSATGSASTSTTSSSTWPTTTSKAKSCNAAASGVLQVQGRRRRRRRARQHRERLAALKDLDGVDRPEGWRGRRPLGALVRHRPGDHVSPIARRSTPIRRTTRHVPVAQFGVSLSEHIVAVDFEFKHRPILRRFRTSNFRRSHPSICRQDADCHEPRRCARSRHRARRRSRVGRAAAPPPMIVNVTTAAERLASLVTRVLDEADAIWRAAGFTFVWRRAAREVAPYARDGEAGRRRVRAARRGRRRPGPRATARHAARLDRVRQRRRRSGRSISRTRTREALHGGLARGRRRHRRQMPARRRKCCSGARWAGRWRTRSGTTCWRRRRTRRSGLMKGDADGARSSSAPDRSAFAIDAGAARARIAGARPRHRSWRRRPDRPSAATTRAVRPSPSALRIALP